MLDLTSRFVCGSWYDVLDVGWGQVKVGADKIRLVAQGACFVSHKIRHVHPPGTNPRENHQRYQHVDISMSIVH
jgi:hypothetical protein